ncbi:hypothetical protein [Pseudonocardia acaciae]|uniref:hypothetical protein n=1 Tax=Pseudonocardia acaciae TaxID=551276 RepID=UPI00068525ED|nr:hypothetical protein [Pseudonocardia acaciae]
MIIDCDGCAVRGDACEDCVVGVFLGMPGAADEPNLPSGARTLQLDAPECRALSVLADQGLVPRLRLVATDLRRASPTSPTNDDLSNAG